MTSRMEFRNYRSSAQLVHCNIHRKRYNHFPLTTLDTSCSECLRLRYSLGRIGFSSTAGDFEQEVLQNYYQLRPKNIWHDVVPGGFVYYVLFPGRIYVKSSFNVILLVVNFILKEYIYHPPTKLREGNVFRCLSVQDLGISGTMSLPEGGYVGGGGISRGWYPAPPQHETSKGVCPGGYGIKADTVGKQVVCILLECFLVNSVSVADYLLRRWMGVFLEEAIS